MTATNQQMTSEQLADLSTLAVQLQTKAEANGDRDTAVMAYAVQKACAELIESRREFTAANATIRNLELQLERVVAENAGLKAAAEFAIAPDMWIEQADGMLDYRYVDWYVDVLKAAMETPATDAYLAEMRAQGVDQFAKILEGAADTCGKAKAWDAQENLIDFAERATGFAAQLRQGAEK